MKTANVAIACTLLTITPACAVGSQMSGIASYYGNELRGHKTANGERFDPDGYTAAHRSYPFGTCLEVSYGTRSVNVRVNDRGPYHKNRSLDLSKRAAQDLKMVGPGTGRVTIQEVDSSYC